MRPASILLIPFLLLQTCLIAQIQTSSLKIAVIDCRNGQPDWSQQLRLYKLPENILYLNIRPYKFKEGNIVIPNFVAGTYRAEYRNVFGENVAKLYQLDDCDSNKLTICVNESEPVQDNILKNLNEGDSIIIEYYSHGCFHGRTERMVIMKRNEYFEATIYPSATLLNAYGVDENPAQVEKITLSGKQVFDFAIFEDGLNRIKKNGGCTTIDNYTITTKWGVRKIQDSGCQWRGYWFLRKSLLDNK